MDPKQSSEKRFALLIDADNVSAKYLKPITDELSKYGDVTYKRIYGDWTVSLHAKWKDALLENSITPIQQFSYTQGKNATDSAMIIDAMDILYTNSVEGFCIVSSDSDFTRLASRIRESGLTVIGMGEKKTPTAFRKACDIFTTLELLLDDQNGKQSGRGKGHSDKGGSGAGRGSQDTGPSIDAVERAVVNIITDNQNNGKSTGLGEVGSRLLKRYPDFDVRSYGTSQLLKLLGDFSSVQVIQDGSSVSVELADDKDQVKVRDKKHSKGHDHDHDHDHDHHHSKLSHRKHRRTVSTECGTAKTSAYKGTKEAGADSVESSASSQDKPSQASGATSPQAFISQAIADAGKEGIALSELGKRVRAEFRTFKIHDLGYPQMRAYLNAQDNVTLEKHDGQFYAHASK